MKINFNNVNIQAEEFNDEVLQALKHKVNEVIHHTVSEVNKDTDAEIEYTVMKDISFSCGFKVKGQDDLLVVTVEHDGQDETLTWNVDLDTDKADSNEEKSNYNEFEKAIMQGKERPTDFETIDSVFTEHELTEVERKEFKGMSKIEYVTKDDFPDTVYRYYQDGRLIMETTDIKKAEG